MNEVRHEMHRVHHYITGAEEWECPECGRRFIIRLEPDFQKVILEQGNENAIHFGGSSAMDLSISQPTQEESGEEIDEDSPIEETTLEPLKRWLETVDFERLWSGD